LFVKLCFWQKKKHSDNTGNEVRVVEFDPTNQVTLAVGTNKGQVAIFDLRKADALLVKDHNYEEPIVSIKFHDLTNHVVSADKKIIKAWEKATVSIDRSKRDCSCLFVINTRNISTTI